MMRMKRACTVVLLLGSLGFTAAATTGCNKAYVQHPGAVNAFDSHSYDALVDTDVVIQKVKMQLAANNFSETQAPIVKTNLNRLIDVYNSANTAYRVYHDAGAAATDVQQAQLQAQINNLDSAKANLASATGGK